MNRRLSLAALAFIVHLGFGSTLMAEDLVLPHYAEPKHLGVASCASGVCHGSVRARTATAVAQNEYVIWSRRDRHRAAYHTLLGEDSKRIAKNMGLKNAHEAGVCLDCHADNVPEEKRGPKFQINDGIGCESCHGGAEFYVSSHVDPETPRQENIDAGLYPTDDARSRAKLCLSCHLGNQQKLATHNIMGAGHPRISFELDTFTALQPAHYVLDEDYRAEKWHGDAIVVWMIGQVEAARATLDLIETRLDPSRMFPELALFDCHACHHGMNDVRWQAGATSLPAGAVRLNDANFVLLEVIAESLDAGIAKQLKADLRHLHRVSQQAQPKAALNKLRGTLDSIDSKLDVLDLKSHAPALLKALVKSAKSQRLNDYVAAEQAVMAADLLLGISGQRDAKSAWLDKLYSSVADEDYFDAAKFRSVMAGL